MRAEWRCTRLDAAVIVVAIAAAIAVAMPRFTSRGGDTPPVVGSAATAARGITPDDAATATVPPYGVGVVHVTLVDSARPTAPRGSSEGSADRTIPVTIRYPTAAPTDGPETENGSPHPGSFPLVVFAHGYAVTAETYAAMEHELAAAGFVVAAPDFPLTSTALPGPPDENDLVNQPADVSFVIDALTSPSATPRFLRSLVADVPVGVIGHSDGGVTVAAVAFAASQANPKIGAGVVLSGAFGSFAGPWFPEGSPALLVIHGDSDEINPLEHSEQIYERDRQSPRWFVTIDGGTHLAPFTTSAIRPQISALIADFLRAALTRDHEAADRVPTDASVPGLTLRAST